MFSALALDAESEAAATRILGEATTAYEQGDIATARQLMITLLSTYPHAAAAQNALTGAIAPQRRSTPEGSGDEEKSVIEQQLRAVADAMEALDYATARTLIEELDFRFPDNARAASRVRPAAPTGRWRWARRADWFRRPHPALRATFSRREKGW